MTSRQWLRSSSSHLLAVPRIRLSTVGKRAFSVSGGTVWNNLPPHVTSAPSLAIFRQRLNSFLFSQSYSDINTWLTEPSSCGTSNNWHYLGRTKNDDDDDDDDEVFALSLMWRGRVGRGLVSRQWMSVVSRSARYKHLVHQPAHRLRQRMTMSITAYRFYYAVKNSAITRITHSHTHTLQG